MLDVDPDVQLGVGNATLRPPMAKKKRNKYPKDYKAGVLKRVREARRTGSESIEAIAKDLKINATNIHNWLREKDGKPRREASKKARARVTNGANGHAVRRSVTKREMVARGWERLERLRVEHGAGPHAVMISACASKRAPRIPR